MNSDEENALTAIANKEIAATKSLLGHAEEALQNASIASFEKAFPLFARMYQIGSSRLRKARAELARAAGTQAMLAELPT